MNYITRDGFALLVMGYTGGKAMKFEEAYIRQFNEMEKVLAKRDNLRDHLSTDDIKKIWMKEMLVSGLIDCGWGDDQIRDFFQKRASKRDRNGLKRDRLGRFCDCLSWRRAIGPENTKRKEKRMSNLEQEMKKVAAALTGEAETEIPDKPEEICAYIAENYASEGSGGSYTLPEASEGAIGGVRKAAAVTFTEDEATAETCAAAIAEIITNLKAAGVMA